MDLFWYVATLWVLVGLVATLLAIWVGGSLRDEFLRAAKGLTGRKGGLRLVEGRSRNSVVQVSAGKAALTFPRGRGPRENSSAVAPPQFLRALPFPAERASTVAR